MTALTELLAKVEAGTFPADVSASDLGIQTDTGLPIIGTMYLAFSGSTDAARELHEAVLPEWIWAVGPNNAEVWIDGSARIFLGKAKGAAARAWLIAIIRALIAQEKP